MCLTLRRSSIITFNQRNMWNSKDRANNNFAKLGFENSAKFGIVGTVIESPYIYMLKRNCELMLVAAYTYVRALHFRGIDLSRNQQMRNLWTGGK